MKLSIEIKGIMLGIASGLVALSIALRGGRNVSAKGNRRARPNE
jgi:hypothetical protein